LTGGTDGSLLIRGRSGGQVLLNNLARIADGTVDLEPTGSGSAVEMAASREYHGSKYRVGFTASSRGLVRIPYVTDPHPANLTIRSTGVIPATHLQTITGSTVTIDETTTPGRFLQTVTQD